MTIAQVLHYLDLEPLMHLTDNTELKVDRQCYLVPMIPYNQDGIKPRPWPYTVQMTEKQREEKVMLVSKEHQEKIKLEKKSRDEMDYLEVEYTVEETDEEEAEQELEYIE